MEAHTSLEAPETSSGQTSEVDFPSLSLDQDDIRIALFYCYINILDVSQHIMFQKEICGELKGRIRVAHEGINGVICGQYLHLRYYERALRSELERMGDPDTWELDIKYGHLRTDLSVAEQLFDSLIVTETKQVVSLVEQCQEPQRTKRRRQKASSESYRDIQEIWAKTVDSGSGAHHLSPSEWDALLSELSRQPDKNVVLLDCRNFYESNIGHFITPKTTTILTNTRKYSELPQVLLAEAQRLESSSHIFMYCTGGVRCERASSFLKKALEGSETQPKIYQLHGGIQRYLEQPNAMYYRGKNFVFDPRRTDPVHNDRVGECIQCHCLHDDYDNGHAPSEGKEARCCNCRILILVCAECRTQVSCWGENKDDNPPLYCGGLQRCLHRPPVREIRTP